MNQMTTQFQEQLCEMSRNSGDLAMKIARVKTLDLKLHKTRIDDFFCTSTQCVTSQIAMVLRSSNGVRNGSQSTQFACEECNHRHNWRTLKSRLRLKFLSRATPHVHWSWKEESKNCWSGDIHVANWLLTGGQDLHSGLPAVSYQSRHQMPTEFIDCERMSRMLLMWKQC